MFGLATKYGKMSASDDIAIMQYMQWKMKSLKTLSG